MRNGDWMSTFTGRAFWPCDPRPEEICIEDIAHHLSLICRFTGACREFYSVGQHSVLLSRIVPEKDAKWGLLHDASEAYLTDVARPVKPHLSNYQEIEDRLMRAVAKQFRLPWPMPESIHRADDIMVCTERRDLLNPEPDWGEWCQGIPLLEDPIHPHCPEDAEFEFLSRYEELFGVNT